MKDAAQCGGCVIVGRGSAFYLQNRTDAFHVFVYAPFAEKVRRLKAQGKSEAEAVQLAETVDRDRAAFIKQYFDVVWPERTWFHVMLNSAIGEQESVELILNAMALHQKSAHPAKAGTSAIA